MNWKALYFGKVSPQEVQEAIKDPVWQETRLEMKGRSLLEKYMILHAYLYTSLAETSDAHEIRMIHVRVTNYVTALSRGGLIKPADYREVAQ